MSAADHSLHLVAWVALRALPPERAFAFVVRVGRFLPQRRDRAEVARAAGHLRLGTCLSRAMAVSARAPGSEVVIGVQRPGEFGAHAWVEVGGEPLKAGDAFGAEIVRLRRD